MYLPLSLFILFLTLSASSARPLADVEEASSSTQINISVKVSENVKKQLLKSNSGATTEDTKVKNDFGAELREERSKHMKKVHLKSTEQHGTFEDLVPMRLADSVSWSVPHSKQDHDPDQFYSDYSRPTTRPPSHN